MKAHVRARSSSGSTTWTGPSGSTPRVWAGRSGETTASRCSSSTGGSALGFYGRDGLADMAGAGPEGSGFSGMVLTYVVRSEARVDEILADAEKAGATILKPAAATPWGRHGGSFADPDGYIWSIGYSAQGKDQPYAE